VAAFGSHVDAQWFCEQEFVKVANLVLGFFTTGSHRSAAQVLVPSCVTWKPAVLEGGLGIATELPIREDDSTAADR
jgi:hypothetical protein